MSLGVTKYQTPTSLGVGDLTERKSCRAAKVEPLTKTCWPTVDCASYWIPTSVTTNLVKDARSLTFTFIDIGRPDTVPTPESVKLFSRAALASTDFRSDAALGVAPPATVSGASVKAPTTATTAPMR